MSHSCPLHHQLRDAAARGDLEAVGRLLSDGVAPDEPKGQSWPMLYLAADGNVEGATLLLEAGAAPNSRSADGDSALIFLARYGPKHARPVAQEAVSAFARRLAARGHDFEIEGLAGRTALVTALLSQMDEVVAVLLELRADPNHGGGGEAPWLAVRSGEAAGRLVRYGLSLAGLIEGMARATADGREAIAEGFLKGAKPPIRSALSEWVTFGLAAMKGSVSEIVPTYRRLPAVIGSRQQDSGGLDPGPIFLSEIFRAVIYRSFVEQRAERAAVLLALDVDIHDGEGNCQALTHAVMRDDLELGRVLLDAGANPNSLTDNGVTPLMLAAGYHLGYEDRACSARKRSMRVDQWVELLEGRGADPQRANHFGQTALHLAVCWYPYNVGRFLEAGCDPLVQDKQGRTAWDLLKDKPIRGPKGALRQAAARAAKARGGESRGK